MKVDDESTKGTFIGMGGGGKVKLHSNNLPGYQPEHKKQTIMKGYDIAPTQIDRKVNLSLCTVGKQPTLPLKMEHLCIGVETTIPPNKEIQSDTREEDNCHDVARAEHASVRNIGFYDDESLLKHAKESLNNNSSNRKNKNKSVHDMVSKFENIVNSMVCCGTSSQMNPNSFSMNGKNKHFPSKNDGELLRDADCTAADKELRKFLDILMKKGAELDAKCGEAWDKNYAETEMSTSERQSTNTDYYSAIGEETEMSNEVELIDAKSYEATEKILADSAHYNRFVVNGQGLLSRSLLDKEESTPSPVHHSKSMGDQDVNHSDSFDVLVRNHQAELRHMLTENETEGSLQTELEVLNGKISAAIEKFNLESTTNNLNSMPEGEKLEKLEQWSTDSSEDILMEGNHLTNSKTKESLENDDQWSTDGSANNSIEDKSHLKKCNSNSSFGIAKFSESFKYFSPEKNNLPSDTAAESVTGVLKKDLKYTVVTTELDRSPSTSPAHSLLNRDSSSMEEDIPGYELVKQATFEKAWQGEHKRESEDELSIEDDKTVQSSNKVESDAKLFDDMPIISISQTKSCLTDANNSVNEEKNEVDIDQHKLGNKPSINEQSNQSDFSGNRLILCPTDEKISFPVVGNNSNDKGKNESATISRATSSVASIMTEPSVISHLSSRSISKIVFNVTRLSCRAQAKFDNSVTELGKIAFRESKISVPSTFVILPYEMGWDQDGTLRFLDGASEKDVLNLGERILDIIRASGFIRSQDVAEDNPGTGEDDYLRNIENLRRSIDKFLKLYSKNECYLYLVDEYNGNPIIPFEVESSIYPLNITSSSLKTLFPLMHLNVLLARGWQGLNGLSKILCGYKLSADAKCSWIPANGPLHAQQSFDPVMFTDEIRVIREALELHSESINRSKNRLASPELTCLTRLLDDADSLRNYSGLVRAVDSWGSILWTTEQSIVEIREDASPESILGVLNEWTDMSESNRLKDESIKRLTLALSETAKRAAAKEDESNKRHVLVSEGLQVAKKLSAALCEEEQRSEKLQRVVEISLKENQMLRNILNNGRCTEKGFDKQERE